MLPLRPVCSLTPAGTVVALIIVTPLMVIFSPILIPAVIATGLLITGFLTSGGFGNAAVTVLSWIYSYMTGKHPPGVDQLDQAKLKLASKSSGLGLARGNQRMCVREIRDFANLVGGNRKEICPEGVEVTVSCLVFMWRYHQDLRRRGPNDGQLSAAAKSRWIDRWSSFLQSPCSSSFSLAPPCDAATYTVGDASGWDISTDLDTWPQGKTFYVGDVLVFQYSSSDDVEELSKEYYDNCTTTRALQSYSKGNTSIPLMRPGAWYFASGNRLYCLGGMKLQVNVERNNSLAGSPAEAPKALTQPTTKSGNDPFNPKSDAPRQQLPRLSCLLMYGLVWSYRLQIVG